MRPILSNTCLLVLYLQAERRVSFNAAVGSSERVPNFLTSSLQKYRNNPSLRVSHCVTGRALSHNLIVIVFSTLLPVVVIIVFGHFFDLSHNCLPRVILDYHFSFMYGSLLFQSGSFARFCVFTHHLSRFFVLMQ